MSERPYVLLSCAISVDGCLDAPGPERLVLSGDADLDRVDGVRAASDAIMVGAGTIRRDDPRLLIRSARRRAERVARGLPEHPDRVTLTATGDLDPRARFFSPQTEVPAADAQPAGIVRGEAGPAGVARGKAGPAGVAREEAGPAGIAREGAGAAGIAPGEAGPAAVSPLGAPEGEAAPTGGALTSAEGRPAPGSAPRRLVYCPRALAASLRTRLNERALVVGLSEPVGLSAILADLSARGIRRLLVEGGGGLAQEFLTSGLVDELHLVVAPFFVGDPAAPRFAGPGVYPHGPQRPMRLAEVRRLDEVVLLRYLLPAGPPDAGRPDAGSVEAGSVEAGPVEAGPVEAEPAEAGPVEAGPVEAGPVEAGPVEAGPVEADDGVRADAGQREA